ncbi:hypothetical protein LOK49_LG09G00453 [Camellia lanceoleosa]|uniref:Uncharacterized protein n=1 Tax=Camellia lanceoleosa TaxID=1840588 RepID=A0ACC0GK01_9ERIC|nr:hypothetical protein LOK49_LG09G00453 [Camellia lanceoleosa]
MKIFDSSMVVVDGVWKVCPAWWTSSVSGFNGYGITYPPPGYPSAPPAPPYEGYPPQPAGCPYPAPPQPGYQGVDDRDRRKGGHLLDCGARRDAEDRLIPRSVDANDADVELKAAMEVFQILTNHIMPQDRQKQDEELKVKEADWSVLPEDPNFPMVLHFLRLACEFGWDDDVVFKNQARGEFKAPKRFINDTIRNDFHQKFLHKYMK